MGEKQYCIAGESQRAHRGGGRHRQGHAGALGQPLQPLCPRRTEGLQNHPVEYNDLIVRQLVECIKVTDADILNVYFKDETEINVEL